MARARLLKPGFFTNEVLAELPFEGRLLFAGLWTLADKAGRLEDRPRRIKASLFPWDEVDVSAHLAALETKGFIDRYMVSGMPLIQIAKFAEHQTPHQREAESILPGPGGEPSKGSVEARSRSPVTGNRCTDPVAVTGQIATASPFLEFPTMGKPNVWPLEEPQIVEWVELYPSLDIRSESRKALAWVKANMGRRKTARGMKAFLVAWFSRSVDRPRQQWADSPKHAVKRWSWADCPHDPKCGSAYLCEVQRTIQEGRKKTG